MAQSIVCKEGESWRDCALRYARANNLEREVAKAFDAAIGRGDDDAAAAFLVCEALNLTEQMPTPYDMPES
jgi:hypothetical protein